jgi:MFS transporter, DHA2 family, metal-tetracycline-proton antiporter
LQFSYPAVVTARGLQGAGASAIPALITVLVARHIPPHERGKVFGTITSTVAFAIGIGPVIGGFVSGTLRWSLLFVIPLFTLIAVRFFLRTLPMETRKPGSVDIPGALLVASGVSTFMLFLTFGRWYFLAASILLLAGFVVDLLVAKEPFIELSLLRNDVFRKRVTVGFTVFAVVIGILFVVPLMLSSLRGLTTTQIGLVLFPGALASAALGTYGGNLADRRGNTFVVVIGFVLLVAGFVVLSLVLSGSFVIMGAALVLVYVGFNFVQTALFNSVSQMLEARDTGIGMGLFNLITFISGAVGTALIGRYLQGNWLSFFRNPLVADNARIYSNLILALIVFSAVAAVVYLRSARRQATTTS